MLQYATNLKRQLFAVASLSGDEDSKGISSLSQNICESASDFNENPMTREK
jgi:hypothetical protein